MTEIVDRIGVKPNNINFKLLLMATAQAALGPALFTIAVAFIILKLTGSQSQISLIFFLKFSPMLLVPLVGAYLDLFPIKPVLVVGNLARAFLMLLLSYMLIYKNPGVEWLYSISLMTGIIAAILVPANRIIIPRIIDKSYLRQANAWYGMIYQGLTLIGFLIGGLLVSLIGAKEVIGLEGICYFLTAIIYLFMQIGSDEKAKNKKYLLQLKEGFSLLFSHRLLKMLAFMLFVLSMLLAPIYVLLPKIMESIGAGAHGYGTFMGILLLGMILINILIAGVKRFSIKPLYSFIIGWLLCAFVFLSLALSNNYYILLLDAFIFGIATGFLDTHVWVLMQKTVPQTKQGVITGTLTAVTSISLPLAFLAMSPIVALVKLQVIYALFSIMSAFFIVVLFFNANNFQEQQIAFDDMSLENDS